MKIPLWIPVLAVAVPLTVVWCVAMWKAMGWVQNRVLRWLARKLGVRL